ncbi:UNVERIFIED_CONTAM: hypothetical protein FKN15_067614 [Acipenser sinensis]
MCSSLPRFVVHALCCEVLCNEGRALGVSGASGILSVSQSFGSFGCDYKGITPARDAKSCSVYRPRFSNPKVWSL